MFVVMDIRKEVYNEIIIFKMNFAKMGTLLMAMDVVRFVKLKQGMSVLMVSTLFQFKHVIKPIYYFPLGSPICGDSLVIDPETCDDPTDKNCINC
jgi:hypothetical protein